MKKEWPSLLLLLNADRLISDFVNLRALWLKICRIGKLTGACASQVQWQTHSVPIALSLSLSFTNYTILLTHTPLHSLTYVPQWLDFFRGSVTNTIGTLKTNLRSFLSNLLKLTYFYYLVTKLQLSLTFILPS